MIGRVPPQNIEAEQSVLGAILLDKEALHNIDVEASDFYRDDHKEIFSAILELSATMQPIDMITVSDNLSCKGMLDSCGGLEYLAEVQSNTPTSASIKYYADIVKNKARLRKQIIGASSAIEMAYEEQEADSVQQKLEETISTTNHAGMDSMEDMVQVGTSWMNQLEKKMNNKGQIPGRPTGFVDLDIDIGGLQDTFLYIVGARPAMGKTAFVSNIATHIALQKVKLPIPFFSLEMSSDKLMDRTIASMSLVNLNKLQNGKLEENELIELSKAMSVITGTKLMIDDRAATTVQVIASKCRRLKSKYGGLGAVFIDYLQLISPSNSKGRSKEQEISEISRSLKILAKELCCPVMCLAQVNRACEARVDKRPMMSDLRDSGGVEQDADVIMFLYRDDYYNPDTEKKNVAEVIIAKNRYGATKTIELAWLGQYTKFANLERGWVEDAKKLDKKKEVTNYADYKKSYPTKRKTS